MSKIILVVMLFCLAADVPPSNQPTHDINASARQTLSLLTGSWAGNGKFFGMTATQRLRWEQVLEGKYLRLSLRVEAKAKEGGQQFFEGHAYYRETAAMQYTARWFDSQGHDYPIKGQFDSDTLTAFWGEPSQETGKSTYRLLDAGKKLEVVDATRAKDGSWKEFARFVLSRTGE